MPRVPEQIDRDLARPALQRIRLNPLQQRHEQHLPKIPTLERGLLMLPAATRATSWPVALSIPVAAPAGSRPRRKRLCPRQTKQRREYPILGFRRALLVPEEREQPLWPFERCQYRLRSRPPPILDSQGSPDERPPLALQRREWHIVHVRVVPKSRRSKQRPSSGETGPRSRSSPSG